MRNVDIDQYDQYDQDGSDQLLNPGTTEFSAHVASNTHKKSELEVKILCTDDNWFNRGVKEAIAIIKIRPTLNADEGRHHLSAMYNQLIKSSVTMGTPRQGTKNVTSESTEEGH